VLNWKTETKTSVSHKLTLELKPKKKWNYEIWPANIKSWSWKIETNSVKIEVTWDKLFVNNNHLKIPTWNNTPQIQNTQQKNDDENIDFTKDIEKEKFEDNNTKYLFLLTLILIWIWTYYIINNKQSKQTTKENNNLQNEKIEEINYEIWENENYPEITENNFIEKIENIFKKKLKNKYNINEIENKTYEEIIESINNVDEKAKIKEISNKINKAKYSNLVNDNSSLILLIKDL
jgi:hypothetical protein